MPFRIFPREERFFDLFVEDAENVLAAARQLEEMMRSYDDVERRAKELFAMEHHGDELSHAIGRRLNTTFVTPFDREDIHALAEELDDVVDDMLEVSHRLQISTRSQPLPELKEQADLLVKMADEAVALMKKLSTMRGVQPHLEAIDRLESEGDSVYRRTLAHLFSGEYDALDVLRWKDIVEAMEAALNTLEDVSNVVEGIVLKHA